MTKKDINLVYDGIFLTFPANINKNNININNKNVSYFLMGISCEKELGLMNFFRNDENLWILCDEKLRVEYSWEELIKYNSENKSKPLILFYLMLIYIHDFR